MAGRSKILVIGATGYIGKFIVEASAKAGHHTFALVRDTTASNPKKAKLIDSFKSSGVTILQGDIYDHKSLVKPIEKVDIVISAVGFHQIADQVNIVAAIKEAGGVKRFLPSEFGPDVDRSGAVDPTASFFRRKANIRRMIEAEGIPYTFVVCNGFGRSFWRNLGQINTTVPPRDRVTIFGDGNTKAICVDEEDIATYTIKAADDPRTLNKILHLRPRANILSYNELVSIWENKIGKTIDKTYILEDQLLKSIQESSFPLNLHLSIAHAAFVKGDNANFEIDAASGVEASELYPEVEETLGTDFSSLNGIFMSLVTADDNLDPTSAPGPNGFPGCELSEQISSYHVEKLPFQDIRKAFDSMSWDLLLAVLNRFGFCTKFCSWIILILTSAKISILINGVLEGYLVAREGFSKGSLLPISSPRNFSSPSYLLYVDDVLMFCRGTYRNMSGIFYALNVYDSLSGQIVNLDKSHIYFRSGVSHSLKANILGSRLGRLCLINSVITSKFVHTFMVYKWPDWLAVAFELRLDTSNSVGSISQKAMVDSLSSQLKVNIDGAADGCPGLSGCGGYFVTSRGFIKVGLLQSSFVETTGLPDCRFASRLALKCCSWVLLVVVAHGACTLVEFILGRVGLFSACGTLLCCIIFDPAWETSYNVGVGSLGYLKQGAWLREGPIWFQVVLQIMVLWQVIQAGWVALSGNIADANAAVPTGIQKQVSCATYTILSINQNASTRKGNFVSIRINDAAYKEYLGVVPCSNTVITLANTFDDLDDELSPVEGRVMQDLSSRHVQVQERCTSRGHNMDKTMILYDPTIDLSTTQQNLDLVTLDQGFANNSTVLPTMWIFASHYLDNGSIVQSEEQIISVDIPKIRERLAEEAAAQVLLDEALLFKKTMLRDQCRVKWLKEGDCNSKFFHSLLQVHKSQCPMSFLSIHGVNFSDDTTIKSYIMDYYRSLFSIDETLDINFSRLDGIIPSLVTIEDNLLLTRSPASEEVKQAVFNLDPTSALSPDDFLGFFFQA
ncbi:hypothetical protein FNV43_RR19375 [Rhamnella rubrinervis]|uniref:NmrA-like domain-containing protein n=1 Tax=Rhamnella rubrinervis TaxID=2594499 RepID=A0A8K0E7V1_9ROSA|nr:hypothetical protein FNV43_RR19375 [Rhamnella rubrinervis]